MSEGSLGSLPTVPDDRVSSQEGLVSEICGIRVSFGGFGGEG